MNTSSLEIENNLRKVLATLNENDAQREDSPVEQFSKLKLLTDQREDSRPQFFPEELEELSINLNSQDL